MGLPDDIHHYSAIRKGDVWMYNGVGGDAFRFGNKPSMTSLNFSPNLHVQDISQSPDTECVLNPDSIEYCDSRSSTSSEQRTPTRSRRRLRALVEKRSSVSSVASSTFSSKVDVDEQSTLPPIPKPQQPRDLGLPPILPPPPAAHLPPPLPSRPPSALPLSPRTSSSRFSSSIHSQAASCISSGSSSCMSTNLQDDRRVKRILPSTPSQDPDDTSPARSEMVYRSSGTITMKESPHNIVRQSSMQEHSEEPSPSRQLVKKSVSMVAIPQSRTGKALITASHASSTLALFPLSQGSSSSTVQEKKQKKKRRRKSSRRRHKEKQDESFSNQNLESRPGTLAIMSPSQVRNRNALDASTDCKDSDTAYESASGDSDAEDNSREENFTPRDTCKESRSPSRSRTESSGHGPIPPEINSIRKKSTTVAEVVTNALIQYKSRRKSKHKELPKPKTKAIKPHFEKSQKCRKCQRLFGLRCFRHHCSRCRKAFCEKCIPITVYEADDDEESAAAASLSRVCSLCSAELEYENSRGQTRGLWSEFDAYRSAARSNRGLEVTTSGKDRQQLEVQSILDMVPKLRGVCMNFLAELDHVLSKSHRRKFVKSYLHFEQSAPEQKKKLKGMKVKECQYCRRQMRSLGEIRTCAMCEHMFCKLCTYRTLQLYLPPNVDLRDQFTMESIKFHVKEDEKDDVKCTEVSEAYLVCMECEDQVLRNLQMLEFNQTIPSLEEEMFDLQRLIDHALSFVHYMPGLKRTTSSKSIASQTDNSDEMFTNVKLANKLYDRYMRAYDKLGKMKPHTPGQRTLHKHIYQTMYDFYIKRNDQLKAMLQQTASR